MNEVLHGLDFYDFLNPKWATIGKYGAGAIGIITPNQMVNVLNIQEGIGEHIDTKNAVLRKIFGVTENIVDESTKEEVLKSIVTLKYSHTRYKRSRFRNVMIEIPDTLTPYQFETLKCLSQEFDELMGMGFFVFVSGNGLENIERGQNQLKDALKELSKRVNYTSTFAPNEQLATFNSDNELVTTKTQVKIEK